MKKIVFSTMLILSMLFPSLTRAANDISVTFNGQKIVFDEQPRIINNSVMVPMRKIFEVIGAEVKWDSETRTVTAIKNAQYVKFTADNVNMELGVCKDGKNSGEMLYYADTNLDSAPLIVNESMLIPVRAISEAFYYDVSWNSDNKRVEIKTTENPEGWIYYASWTDSGHMYKIDTNGQNRQILSENDCYYEGYGNLVYNDGYIYYSIRGEDEGCLYRIKTDGTGEEKLTDMPVELLYDYNLQTHTPFIGDYIYFHTRDTNNRGYVEYTVALYKLNVKTKELIPLLDEEIPSYGIQKYGDYIYFQYKNDKLAHYRMDGDGENIINVTGDLPVRYFSINNNDRISFTSERNNKKYTAALDGSDLQEEEDYSYEKIDKYDIEGILTEGDEFFVGYKYTDDYKYIYLIIDNNGKELFRIIPPQNADIHHGAEIIGRKIYYSITPEYTYEHKKLYVDSIDELLGMKILRIGSEKVDGKYEVITSESVITKSDFEAEVHCLDLDNGSDTIILKGYSLQSVTKPEIGDNKMILAKETDDNKIEYYTANLDGSNLQKYTEEQVAKLPVNLNEETNYGIIVSADNKVSDYRNINIYQENISNWW